MEVCGRVSAHSVVGHLIDSWCKGSESELHSMVSAHSVMGHLIDSWCKGERVIDPW